MASVKVETTAAKVSLELELDEAMFIVGVLGAQRQDKVFLGKGNIYNLLADALEDAGFSENSEVWRRSLQLARERGL